MKAKAYKNDVPIFGHPVYLVSLTIRYNKVYVSEFVAKAIEHHCKPKAMDNVGYLQGQDFSRTPIDTNCSNKLFSMSL